VTDTWQVPLTDLKLSDEDVAAVLDCLRGGWLTMGPRTQAFEDALKCFVGSDHAVAVSSGTAALHLALLALGIGPGDEVVLPAFTFVADAAAVRAVGAEPVLCDIVGPGDFTLDLADVERLITPRTRAVIGVHFMGYPFRAHELRTLCDERGLVLVEDVAQAIGARCGDVQAGTVGHAGCFSFFSKKQLAVGEGGMVTTADDEVAAKVRSLRSHAMTSVTWDRHRGHADTYDVVDVGFNYRLDEARSALGLSRLERLQASIDDRRAVVRKLRAGLADVPGIEIPFDEDAVEASSHFAFAVLVADAETRTALRAGLRDRGVQTTWYPSLTSFTDYRDAPPAPRAEDVALRHCCLPLSPGFSDETIDYVVEAVRATVSDLSSVS
jgi:dTDP-4-amino-4,6-dideoxygalactose transaminase